MCGIAGFADFKNQGDLGVLKGMAAVMPHRGPDGQSEHLTVCGKAHVGLAHRRLSIIDLSHAADQPMHFDGLSVVFNGEIYNYAELRAELSQLGHQFDTHSDTEVVLHSWRQWGQRAIERWHGMFAIVLLDERLQQIICIRDRAGVKPLFYSHVEGLFLFGSELKCLVAHPRFQKVVDHGAVASFLQYGYVPAPQSIFRGTHKLLPGHLARLDLASGTLETEQYWNVYDHYNKPKLDIALPDAIDETARLLKAAFEYRLVADVPVGVFLSGGYDSTCVTALLQEGRTERLKTFTIGMPDQALDEAPFAKQIARHLGTDHTEYYCTVRDALDIIPELPEHYDEPFADSSAIPTLLVSRMAKKSVTVALSADGGDEVFAGYNRYDYIARFGAPLQAIPEPARRLLVAAMDRVPSSAIPFLRSRPHFHSRYDKLKNLVRDPSSAELLKNLTQVFRHGELTELLAVPFTPASTQHDSTELRNGERDPLSFMMAIDYQTYLADDILQKVDRATMSTSLEGREPFLDQDVIEWAARLPSDYKYRAGTKKYIVREIVHRHVPRAMMDRPKMGFGIPVHAWLRGPLAPLVREVLGEASLSRHGILRAEVVREVVDQFYAGSTHLHVKLWHMLMFQLWYERWMGPC